uniref:Uncharacterized protein n=1 Tax=Candidatus Kentrum eta TaxID=2126337 RepID=A0A450VBN9_9GAMM|nr:MAG: hypothetical protein BECKH772A_GA0070896_1008515 [Candidatus Kentron sp. H]VFJ96211.1 MAG: hypothetical protein BECKH772B_GA0070898_1008815 [Candidatus Kentron sp. H]VFK02209.1 MAG: hypothetical protein BECKH772C_GA0070978_1008415 [Candidatus Kentron sp. H]
MVLGGGQGIVDERYAVVGPGFEGGPALLHRQVDQKRQSFQNDRKGILHGLYFLGRKRCIDVRIWHDDLLVVVGRIFSWLSSLESAVREGGTKKYGDNEKCCRIHYVVSRNSKKLRFVRSRGDRIYRLWADSGGIKNIFAQTRLFTILHGPCNAFYLIARSWR